MEDEEEDEGPAYDPMIPEQWLERCQEFSELHIMKFARIWQSIIYLTQYKLRDEICEFDTCKLSWKAVRQMMNTQNEDDGIKCLFQCMGDYKPFGPKPEEFLEYQKLKFIRDNVEEIEMSKVEEYSMALAKMLQWLNEAVQFRIDDVQTRRDGKQAEREAREEEIERDNEWQEKRKEALEESRNIWQEGQEAAKEDMSEGEKKDDDAEEKPPAEFDEKKWDEDYVEENPKEVVREEITDDIDNDFNVEVEGDEHSDG